MSEVIDAERPDPLYRRLADELISDIESGRIAPGSALPTEHELCRLHGVSRITVRRALDVLTEGHYVLRRRGVGTFARPTDPDRWTAMFDATLEDVLPPPRLSLLREATAKPPADVLAFAELPADQRMRMLEAMNHVPNGEPLAHLHLWFPLPLGEKVTGAMLGGPLPPPRLVERQLGVRIDHAVQAVEPVIAGARVARHLRIGSGVPVLRALRVYRDRARRAVYVCDVTYHPRHFRLTARLQTARAAGASDARERRG
jgi:GntR family transcriptional regulator